MKKNLISIATLSLLFSLATTSCGSGGNEKATLTELDSINNLIDSAANAMEAFQDEMDYLISEEGIKEAQDADAVIKSELSKFLKDEKSKVKMSRNAERNTFEMTWTEMQCRNCGELMSAIDLQDFTVEMKQDGMYVYYGYCPYCPNAKKVECMTTIFASLQDDGTVMIDNIVMEE